MKAYFSTFNHDIVTLKGKLNSSTVTYVGHIYDDLC